MRQALWLVALGVACERAKPVELTPGPGLPDNDGVRPTKLAVADAAISDGVTVLDDDAPKWAHDPPAVLRDKINAVNAHVIVLKIQATFAEYRDVLANVEHTPGVVAAEPFIFAEIEISSDKHGPVSGVLKAADPTRIARVMGIGPHMTSGTLDTLRSGDPPPIILGDELANTLGVAIGDRVTLRPSTAQTAWPGAASATWPDKTFRLSGTFHLDFDEYDGKLTIAPLAAVQAMIGKGDQVMGIEATVKDLAKSADIAAAIEKQLGGLPYKAQDWYELNKLLFTTLYGSKRP